MADEPDRGAQFGQHAIPTHSPHWARVQRRQQRPLSPRSTRILPTSDAPPLVQVFQLQPNLPSTPHDEASRSLWLGKELGMELGVESSALRLDLGTRLGMELCVERLELEGRVGMGLGVEGSAQGGTQGQHAPIGRGCARSLNRAAYYYIKQ